MLVINGAAAIEGIASGTFTYTVILTDKKGSSSYSSTITFTLLESSSEI